jgi:flagellar hook protein FlgE
MYSAVSGLAAHQTKMNIIGNNIANVNTYGFKSSRVTFTDVFYQTMSGASAPDENGNGGGSNPTQMGYGTKINSINVINTRAGSATTDRALDVYINGDGYLPVKNADGVIKYTRVGVLNFDKAGNLVDSTGNQVFGFVLDPVTKKPALNSDGNAEISGLKEINIAPSVLEKLTGIAIGQNGEITGIQEGDPTVIPSANTSWMEGIPTISATSTYNGRLTMSAEMDFTQSLNGPGISISSNANVNGTAMTLQLDPTSTTYTLNYTDGSGAAKTATALAADIVDGKISFEVASKDLASTATITVPLHATDTTLGYIIPNNATGIGLGTADPAVYNLTAKTFDKSGAVVTLTDTWDSAAVPADTKITFGDIDIEIDPTAFETTLDSGVEDVSVGNIGPGAGLPVKLAQIASVKFTNPDGLSQDGQGYFVGTTNSGLPVATIPGSGGTGTFRAGALEMSNVDLSREFTEMIITQRGFQANTRMITVSDEMLSELISMKR